MDDDKTFDLYEKVYFHEISIRDKLQSRMQIPFAILVGQFGFLSYMLRNLRPWQFCFDSALFWALFIFSAIFTSLSVYFFVRSWYGYAYAYLPSSEDIYTYQLSLKETHDRFDNKDSLVTQYMRDFVRNCYVKCSSTNTRNNDRRSYFSHRTNQCLIVAFVLAFLAFLPFHFGQLNVSAGSIRFDAHDVVNCDKVPYPSRNGFSEIHIGCVHPRLHCGPIAANEKEIARATEAPDRWSHAPAPSPAIQPSSPPATTSSNQSD